MKKILILIIFFFFSTVAHATVVQVGQLPIPPDYSINTGDTILYIYPNYITQVGFHSDFRIYDDAGNLILKDDYPYNINDWLILESANYIYITKWFNYIYIYNKINKDISWRYGIDRWGMMMEDEILVISDGNDEVKINIAVGYVDITYSTGSIYNPANLAPMRLNYLYRLSSNNINYLDEDNKTLEWYITDSVGDVINIWDFFISTWSFFWYNMIYEPLSATHILSIYWDSDMRAYYDYGLGSVSYLSDLYYSEVFGGELVAISTPSTMGYNYHLGVHSPIINLIDKGAWPTRYRVDDNGTIWKDTTIDTTGILVWFPGVEAEDEVSLPSKSIFNTDLNGDGVTDITEALRSVFLIPSNIIISAWDYIKKIKEILDKLLDNDSPAFRSILNFVPASHAGFFVELTSRVSSREQEQESLIPAQKSILYKYKSILNVGLYFLIFIFIISIFIFLKLKKEND